MQIRVNAIHPTIVMTEMGKKAWEDPKKHMKYLVRTPMGHFAGKYSPQSFNPFPNKPWFFHVGSTSLMKTLWEKEKLLVTSNFSFSQRVFYPFGEPSAIFIEIEIVVCKLGEFGRG